MQFNTNDMPKQIKELFYVNRNWLFVKLKDAIIYKTYFYEVAT